MRRIFGDNAKLILENFIGTFAFTKVGGVGLEGTRSLEETGNLVQELGWRSLVRGRVDAISASTLDSWFQVRLNGVQLVLPRYTIMTMRHCIMANATGELEMMVETPHWDLMKAELQPGALFLDIGAATGAMSVPYAIEMDGEIKIVAFEPSARAREYLEATIARNSANNVRVIDKALSDGTGVIEFIELPEDETGEIPYLPEASRLSVENETLEVEGQIKYDVQVRTLDSLADEIDFDGASKIVIKMDVEGFEDKVLAGALETLKKYKPFLSIDIHKYPGEEYLTDTFCREILEPLGYRIETMGHVMIARVD